MASEKFELNTSAGTSVMRISRAASSDDRGLSRRPSERSPSTLRTRFTHRPREQLSQDFDEDPGRLTHTKSLDVSELLQGLLNVLGFRCYSPVLVLNPCILVDRWMVADVTMQERSGV